MSPKLDRSRQKASRDQLMLNTLSDHEKKQMCVELLEEFGVGNITERDSELIHSCCLPFGLHSNGDAKPSASLNWEKMVYNCFGCGSGGSLLWFVAVCRNESEDQVRKWAQDKTPLGGEDPISNLWKYLEPMYHPGERMSTRVALPRFNPDVLTPWYLIHPYLTEQRHIPEGNLIRHRIGFDEKTNRIIFPFFVNGSLVGWQSRRIVNDGTPKYTNTPDFPRDVALYNGDLETPTKLVVVESPMTVVSKAHLDGYGFVATFGAMVTKAQTNKLATLAGKCGNRVRLWFDNDEAGWKATEQLAETLVKYMDVLVVESPWNEDAGGLDDDTTLALLNGAVTFSEWKRPSVVKEWCIQ